MVREGRVFRANDSNGKPEFGSGYSVTAYEPGAVVSTASSGTAIAVYAGHGFEAGDKVMVSTYNANTDPRYDTVGSVSALVVNIYGNMALAEGEILVNLGPDTGSTAPNWDGSEALIYADSGYTTLAVDSTVYCDDNGKYRYYYASIDRWELVRSGSTIIAVYLDTNSVPQASSSDGFSAYLSAVVPPGLDSGSGAVGVFLNKLSTESGAIATNFYVDGEERWSLGMDYVPGDRSYFALWSDQGSATAAGWTTNDIMGISWGGAETQLTGYTARVAGQPGVDGPKWRFNSFFVPGSNPDTYGGNYQFEFYMPTRQASGTGLYNSLFQSVRNVAGATVNFDSGGLQVNVTGARPGLKIINESNSGTTRASFVTVGKGGSTGFNFGCDLAGADTNTWSIYDLAATAYRVYIGSTGYIGIGTGAAIGTDFITGLFAQNAATKLKIDNTSAGNAARAGITGTSDVGYFTLEAFSSTFAADATIQKDTMLYTTGSGAMLHFGTGGTKRVTVLDTAAWVGIGVDPPTVTLDVNGALRLRMSSVSVTGNDAVVTADKSFIALTNTSGTNTVTLNAPSSVDGQRLTLLLVALTAGTLTLADSGNCALSAAWIPNAGDTLELIASGAIWYEIARSAN